MRLTGMASYKARVFELALDTLVNQLVKMANVGLFKCYEFYELSSGQGILHPCMRL